MKRSGKLEKDIRHWMEMRRGSKPQQIYNYGRDYNDPYPTKSLKYDNEYCKSQNELFKEKTNVPLSSK